MTITHNQSYAIISKSDFLKNIVTEFIYTINEEHNIYRNRTLFGKYIKQSNTDLPTSKYIILSDKERTDTDLIPTLDIDNNLPEICFHLYYMPQSEIEQYKQELKYIKQKTKNLNPEIAYYYICAIIGSTRITTDLIDTVLKRQHIGTYTTTEMTETLIHFINSPSETSLFKLITIFNDYQRLINSISSLTNDTPQWVTQRWGNILDTPEFIKTLLKIALIAIESNTQDEFIISVLKKIIY